MKEFGVAVDKYTDDNPISFVDLVQNAFSCCGNEGPQDYMDKEKSVPKSCSGALEGCKGKVPEQLEAHVIVAAGVALGAGAAMVSHITTSVSKCQGTW